MEKRKLLIADGTEDFRLALAEVLQSTYLVRQSADGHQTKELLASFRPDILILDLMLPGIDGITLLQWAVEEQLRPMVLATTRFHSDYVAEAMGRYGVSYLMRKPCEVRAVVARVTDLESRIHAPVVARPENGILVSNLLRVLGMRTKLRGYTYLREAVPLYLKDPTQSITKQLYPAVAARCSGEPENVERSIRSAIENAWKNRDETIWKLYFPADASGHVPRPSNTEFISRLADCLQSGNLEEI